ncbi:MAG: glycine--tRNA ligase subunit beta, partial [Deltaproteobacteria bacterium]
MLPKNFSWWFMAKDLIFEIGCEEVPASFLPRALKLLDSALRENLNHARLGFKDIKALGTPRRLALIAEGVQERQEDVVREIKGPQKKAAYGPDGRATPALEGFMRSQGIKEKDIKIIQTEKGEYVHATKKIKGENALKVLPDVLVKTISAELFPKSMRWGAHDITFARPIHWLLALYGGRLIGFSYGHIKSSSTTRGHRFMTDKKATLFKPDSVSSYLNGLKDRKVMLDPEERKRVIEKGLESNAKEVSGRVLRDDGLVEEVAFLVEWPIVVRGAFDREFLSLPSHVVINAMREHQRYFSVADEKGALLPYFLTVANTDAKDMDVVRKGNERVLMERLNDAKFYFEKDIKTPLEDMAQRL